MLPSSGGSDAAVPVSGERVIHRCSSSAARSRSGTEKLGHAPLSDVPVDSSTAAIAAVSGAAPIDRARQYSGSRISPLITMLPPAPESKMSGYSRTSCTETVMVRART